MTTAARDYREPPPHVRMKRLGSLAEGIFEKWATSKGVAFDRFGMNRPPFKQFGKLPEVVRLSPDYLCEFADRHAFFEVKGTGHDEFVRIRFDSLDAMDWWSTLLPVHVFVYNSKGKRTTTLTHEALRALCEGTEVSQFNDGRQFYMIPQDRFAWERVPR